IVLPVQDADDVDVDVRIADPLPDNVTAPLLRVARGILAGCRLEVVPPAVNLPAPAESSLRIRVDHPEQAVSPAGAVTFEVGAELHVDRVAERGHPRFADSQGLAHRA